MCRLVFEYACASKTEFVFVLHELCALGLIRFDIFIALQDNGTTYRNYPADDLELFRFKPRAIPALIEL